MYIQNIDIINILQTSLEEISSEKKRLWWEKYMKNVIKFRGVGIPQIRDVLKEWYQQYLKNLSYKEQTHIALELFRQDLAEDKLAGVLLLQNYLFDKNSLEYMISQYEIIFEEKLIYDWNICDWFCIRVLANTIKKYNFQAADMISSWKDDDYLWKARASVVAFIGFTNEDRYYKNIFNSSKVLIQRNERFAKTAVGWILHDIYKVNKQIVFNFINENLQYFDKESLKNSLKYCDNNIQKSYLAKLKEIQKK